MPPNTTRTNGSPPTESQRSLFRSDTRAGAASQIDFVNGMILLLFGVIFFFGASTAMLATMSDGGAGDQLGSFRASEKLSGDVFVQNTSDSIATEDCVDAFFDGTTNTTGCDHDTDWDDPNEQQYLRNVLSLSPNQQTSVTLVWNDDGTTRDIGGNPPVDDVGQYSRQIPVDTGSGYRWATVTIYVW